MRERNGRKIAERVRMNKNESKEAFSETSS